jgi:eukaryotic-like serine/threonine-protein kinase
MTSARVPPSELAPPGKSGWRFEPSKRVGSGATADVWRARDVVAGRDVALKMGRGEDAARLLAAEAERLVGALSPHLPELLEVGRVPAPGRDAIAAGTPYLAMTWLPGRALDPSAERSGAERRAIALAIARDVGEALAHLHAAGVAHGDVKPANVQLVHLDRRGGPSEPSAWRANLIDLGLATDAGAVSPTGGTVRYLPPELFCYPSSHGPRI